MKMKNNKVFIQSAAIAFNETFESFPLHVHLETKTLFAEIADFDANENRRLISDLSLKEQTVSAKSKKNFAKNTLEAYEQLLIKNDLHIWERVQIEKIVATVKKVLDSDSFTDNEDLIKDRETASETKIENERICSAIEATLDFLVLEGYLRMAEVEGFKNSDYQLTAKGLKSLGYEIEKNGVLKSKSPIAKLKEALTSGNTISLCEVIAPLIS